MVAARDFLLLYINGERIEVRGADSFMMLSDFLRYRRRLTGTKIVCAEGDCGACTVLRAFPQPEQKGFRFEAFNSCIMPLFLLDCNHVITIEGVREDGALNELQQTMCKANGAQCGFCTPGFVMALTYMFERGKGKDEKSVKNYTTGNLCRCTGYTPILDAAQAVDRSKLKPISNRYSSKSVEADLSKHFRQAVAISDGEKKYFSAAQVKDAVSFKGKNKNTRVFSAATDLGVQINKGHTDPRAYLSLQQIPELYKLVKSGNEIVVGAKVSLTRLEEFCSKLVPEFERFLRIFASPQIKNVATLIGNAVNGSPIGDTLPFLMIANAEVELRGTKGARKIPFAKFYKGYRQADIRADEIVTAIRFQIPKKHETLKLYKVSQRKDLDISCVNAGFRMNIKDGIVADVKIAYGGVGPTVLNLVKTETFLRGKKLDRATVDETVKVIAKEISPLSDVRGAAAFRLSLSQNLFRKFVAEL